MLLDFIVYTIFIVLFLTSLMFNITAFIKNKKLQAQAIELALEKFTVATELSKIISEQESKKIEETDGFLKFISDSRDWAFKYIEDVQKVINDLKLAITKKDDVEIENAYNALIDFLPKEEEIDKKENEEKQ
jgi:uncharacterized membrane protein